MIADESYSRKCPLCGAEPGTPCRSKFGRERDSTHIVRRPADEQRKRPVGEVRALCCVCGNLRMVRSRFRSRGCIGDLDDRHPDLWRMVDMLACSVCGQQTRHARLRDDTPKFRDAAEERDHKELAKRAHGLQHLDDYELLNGARRRVVELLDRFSDKMRPSDLTLEDCYRILDTYKQVADDHGLEI